MYNLSRIYVMFIFLVNCSSAKTEKKVGYYDYDIINNSLKSILKVNDGNDTFDIFIEKSNIIVTPNYLSIKKDFNCFKKDDFKGYINFKGVHIFLYGDLENNLAKKLILKRHFSNKKLLYEKCKNILIPTVDFEPVYYRLNISTGNLSEFNGLLEYP